MRNKTNRFVVFTLVEFLARVPPPAMVALMSESSSSSPRMASCRWRGVMRFTFRSLEALPANSNTWNKQSVNVSRHRMYALYTVRLVCVGYRLDLYDSGAKTTLLKRFRFLNGARTVLFYFAGVCVRCRPRCTARGVVLRNQAILLVVILRGAGLGVREGYINS